MWQFIYIERWVVYFWALLHMWTFKNQLVLYGCLQRHRKQAHKFERIRGGWRFPKLSERCGGWWTQSKPEPCPEQADQCWITRDSVTLLTGWASCCILSSINAPIRPGVIWAEETCDLRSKGRECKPTSSLSSNPLKSEWGIQYPAPCRVHLSFLAENLHFIYLIDAFIHNDLQVQAYI